MIDYAVSGDFDIPYKIGVFAGIDDHAISGQFAEGAGITTPGTHTLKLPATFEDKFADFWLEAIIDIGGEVQETNEENNSLVFEGGAFLAMQPIDGKRVLHVHGTHSDDVAEILAVDMDTIEVRVTAGLPLPTDPPKPPALYLDVTGDDCFTAIDKQAVAFNLASSTTLWQNASNRLDVNNDGALSPADALRIVDHLHNWGTKVLRTAPQTTDNYLDVSGDNVLSRLDLEIVLRAMHSDPNSFVDPETAGGHTWRNAANPLDVNADGRADAEDQTAINNAPTLGAIATHRYELDKIDVVHFRMQRGDDDARIAPSLDLPAWLYGGDGSDLISTARADDQLLGGTGIDFLFGEAGNDKLYGGSDDDWLRDLSGENLLEGGPGNDWYNDNPFNPMAGTVVARLQDIYRGAEDEREWQLELRDAIEDLRMRHVGPYEYDVAFSGAEVVSKSWIADETLHLRFVTGSPGATTATVRVTAAGGHKESRTIRIYSVAVTGFTAERKIGPDEWIVDDGPQWASDEVRYQVEFAPMLPDLKLVVRWLYVPVGQHHLPDNDWKEIGRGDTSRPVQLRLPPGLGAITPELLMPEIKKEVKLRR